MLTRPKLINEIKNRAEAINLESDLPCIRIRNYNQEKGTISQIVITVNSIGDSGDNMAYKIKVILQDIEEEYGLTFNSILLDI